MGKIGKPFLDMLFLCPVAAAREYRGENPTRPVMDWGGNEGRKPLLDMGMVIIQSVVVFFSFWGVVDFKGKILVPLSTFSIF